MHFTSMWPIVVANSIKYLGVMVNDEFDNQEHIQKRIKLAYTTQSTLCYM